MRRFIVMIICLLILQACIPLKELKYLQEDEKLELNDLGFVAPEPEEYRLQVDDILTMNVVSRDPNFAEKYGRQFTRAGGITQGAVLGDEINGLAIKEDGTVVIPRLPKIYLVGLTIDQAREKIEKEFIRKEKYKSGELFVQLQLFGINYSIVGEVNRPGNYIINRTRVNIIEAIAQAGDLTTVADRKKLKLYRRYPEGVRIVELNLTREGLMNSEFFFIQPNDQIIVNPKVQKTLGFGTNALGTFTTLVTVVSGLVTLLLIWNRF